MGYVRVETCPDADDKYIYPLYINICITLINMYTQQYNLYKLERGFGVEYSTTSPV